MGSYVVGESVGLNAFVGSPVAASTGGVVSNGRVGVRVTTRAGNFLLSGTAVGFPDGILVAPVGSYVTEVGGGVGATYGAWYKVGTSVRGGRYVGVAVAGSFGVPVGESVGLNAFVGSPVAASTGGVVANGRGAPVDAISVGEEVGESVIGAGTGKDVGIRVATSGTAVGIPVGFSVAPVVGLYVTGFPKASSG